MTAWLLVMIIGTYDSGITVPGIATEEECRRVAQQIGLAYNISDSMLRQYGNCIEYKVVEVPK